MLSRLRFRILTFTVKQHRAFLRVHGIVFVLFGMIFSRRIPARQWSHTAAGG
jgi:hypothetical protein